LKDKLKLVLNILKNFLEGSIEDLNLGADRIIKSQQTILVNKVRLGKYNKRIATVNVENLIDPLGNAFTDKNHIFNIFISNEKIHDSYIEYKRNKPTQSQGLLGSIWKTLKDSEQYFYPIGYYLFGMPWIKSKVFAQNRHIIEKGKYPHAIYFENLDYDNFLIEKERFKKVFERLTQRIVYHRIKSILLNYKERYPNGFFIFKHGEYRFVVINGKHRAFWSCKMNKKTIKVRIAPSFIPVVEYGQIYDNSLLSHNKFTADQSKGIIDEIFAKSSFKAR
jgi:hypothetical protein